VAKIVHLLKKAKRRLETRRVGTVLGVVVAGSRDSEDVAVVWSCLVVSVDRLSGFVLFAMDSIRHCSPSARPSRPKQPPTLCQHCGESSDASDEAPHSFLAPLRPFWNVDHSPRARSQYGQSDRQEIVSSTRTFGDDAQAKSIDTGWDNSDSEIGRSEHS